MKLNFELVLHRKFRTICNQFSFQLHVAAANGYLKLTKVLIEYNTNVNAQDNDGWSPLHAAACWCQVSDRL